MPFALVGIKIHGLPKIQDLTKHLMSAAESGKVLADFGKAVKLLSECESGALKKALADVGDRADELSAKQQKQVHTLNENCGIE